jgi:hypothetical protein
LRAAVAGSLLGAEGVLHASTLPSLLRGESRAEPIATEMAMAPPPCWQPPSKTYSHLTGSEAEKERGGRWSGGEFAASSTGEARSSLIPAADEGLMSALYPVRRFEIF